MKTLVKIDPEKHMHRWYAVGIQSTLTEGLAVVYGWGSLNSAYQQWRRIPAESQAEAEAISNHLIEMRIKRGYSVARKDLVEQGSNS